MIRAENNSLKHHLWRRLRSYTPIVGMLVISLSIGAYIYYTSPLSLADRRESPADPSELFDDDQRWTCAMHPHIQRTAPDQCPICGMELIPVTSTPDPTSNHHDPQRLVLSERAQALAKLRTTPVQRQDEATATLWLMGRFEPDETTLKTISAWVDGRIDRLLVNITGEQVQKNQPIATLYSPEVFAAHQDLLVAKQQVTQLGSSPLASHQAAKATLQAARERLRLLGVPNKELERMEKQKDLTRALTIRTPFAGTVIERLATEGSYVSTGAPLFRIADLNSLWLQLDVYENDLSRLSVGQPARITVNALPGRVYNGAITFIEPILDLVRRTVKVRVQVDNDGGQLRPGMFAEAEVSTQPPRGIAPPLVIPATAPLFTGRRSIVYVEGSDNHRVTYEARTVRLGPRLGEVYPVVAGLKEGERVVSRGAFALDADLQIQGGKSMMTVGSGWKQEAIDPPAATINAPPRQHFARILSSYLLVQEALANDDLEQVQATAQDLVEGIGSVDPAEDSASHAAWSSITQPIHKHGQHMAKAETLESMREEFEALSQTMIRMLYRFGNPLGYTVRLAYCPMASGSAGARWIQKGTEVDNSYFGAAMRTCGEVQQELAPGSLLPPPSVPSSSPHAADPSEDK